MKKYLSFIPLTLTSLLAFSACESTKISAEEQSPIAIISIVGNQNISWVEESPDEPQKDDEPEIDGLMTGLVNKFLYANDPELLSAVNRLDYVYDSANQIIPDMTGCAIVPKEEVFATQTYQYLRPSYFNSLVATENATGFKDLSTIGAKNARNLMKECNANSILIYSLTFQKRLNRGTRSEGLVEGIATMKVKLLNNRGREIINKVFTEKTPAIKIQSGQYDKNEMIANMNNAIDVLMRKFSVFYMSK